MGNIHQFVAQGNITFQLFKVERWKSEKVGAETVHSRPFIKHVDHDVKKEKRYRIGRNLWGELKRKKSEYEDLKSENSDAWIYESEWKDEVYDILFSTTRVRLSVGKITRKFALRIFLVQFSFALGHIPLTITGAI